MDSQRVLASNPKNVEAYFDLLEDTIKEHNIVPENIYNMDETGFLLGQSQSCNIIVPKENGKNRCFRSHPGNRETITMVECIGAHGPPTPCPMPEDTPTPSTSAKAKQLMAQLFQSLAQHEEQLAQQEDQLQALLQAALLLTQHQWHTYLHNFGRFADWLFNQQVIDQSQIQELTAAHTNRQRTGTGDCNQLSKAQMLHQSDLPQLLAECEEQAQREATKQSHKQARKKSSAMSPALNPPEQAPAPQPQAAESSAQANTFVPPPPPPFPGYNYLMGLLPLSPPLPSFPSSSSVCYDLPGPSWHPAGLSMPPMPPFM
ncbi:related to transposase [Sporisorium reilianum f. sp. reilianum]|uniref:Related to transposase n=1 Tax=Sporisorium reilianum f. sp. reilianum TaxID=72559 RepID=A0A2N8UJZ7_9BASI|nr:related to transposase [Sporisorium reilianum f. sp. reilianum]